MDTPFIDNEIRGENNMFCRLIYKIYNAKKNPQYQEVYARHKIRKVNTDLYKLLLDSDQLIKEIKEENLDFWLLYDFGSFIKIMEKVFFIRNDSECDICCDSIIEDRNTRVIVFNLDKVTIRVVAKLQDQSINIEISRDYGKQMKNIFKIIDDNVDFKSDSDKALLANVISIISDAMAGYIKNIIGYILKGFNNYSIPKEIYMDYCDMSLIDEYYLEINFGDGVTKYTKEYKDIQMLIKKKYIQI